MQDSILEILKIIAPFSVAFIVFSEGLGISARRVVAYFYEKPDLVFRSLIASLVLVPIAALVLILLLKPSHALAIGLAIIVACPPAPLMLKAATSKGGGNSEFMASLHLSLALLALVTVPVIIYLLSRALDFEADVDLGVMFWILARTILLPVGLGLIVRAYWPAIADKLAPLVGKIGTIGLLVVVLIALVAMYPALLNMDAWSYLTIALVSISALAIGHFLGPSEPSERTILAVECGVRHPVLAITIAGSNFDTPQILPIMVPCVITFIAIAMAYMIWRGKTTSKGAA
jgi:BASS family bile acid:Na+ symporter